MMREALFKIIYWTADNGMPLPDAKDVVNAAKNVVMMDLALLSAEIANGMYRKPIDALAKEFQYEPLSPEIRTVVIAAWMRRGLLPKMTEQMVPVNQSKPLQSPSLAET